MSQAGPAVDLDTSVGYRLKQATAVLHAAMEDVLRPLGLSITQYSTLELLAQRPGMSSAGLARGAFVTRQSMSLVLQGLESGGLVVKQERPSVGRVLPVELTAAGRERLAAASAAVRSVEDRMRSGFDDGDARRLAALLDRCVEGLRG
ncbi:MarR family winged helix-turn-helix transcriptional regulator [Amnibacterium setariae]|uniref:MarR family transcriptional regulator n=1 Tax=Amnibacterium setariae TaxID=2306585 RepID=A0A3A1U3I3_9MICO|nr:MarR family transcriptional regulator [Amnibacterium setariae]RIX29997.1 MarR family transcriptional regulator [Amnibacterium setariae]